MILLICAIFFISSSFSQYAVNLHSVSRCFNNCLQCEHNELTTCISQSKVTCVDNYYQSGSECLLDKTYYNEKTLINKNGEFKQLQKWEIFESIECSYTKSNGQTEGVSVMGLFEASATNSLKISVQPFYQSLFMSFNLVRNSWIPYMDFMEIQFKDNLNRSLANTCNEMMRLSIITTIVCNDQKLVVQNFQVGLDFKHQNISKIVVEIRGLMHGEQLWGFTDVKIAFGCRNNLMFSSNSCYNCQPGYYIDLNNTVDGAPTCPRCSYKCATCNKQKCFTCIEGMQLIGIHANHHSAISLPDVKSYCNVEMLMSQLYPGSSKHSIEGIKITIGQAHKQARLIFQLYLADSQWSKQSAVIVQVDGRQIKRIKEDSVHGRLRQNCSGFAAGYYSTFSVASSYFDHNTSYMTVRIYSTDDSVVSLGIGEMHIEIQLYQPKPVPFPQPIPQLIPIHRPQPQPTVQPVVPLPKTVPIIDSEIGTNLAIKDQIDKLAPYVGQIGLSYTTVAQSSSKVSSNQLLLSINYPLDITDYPYIYCYFQGLGIELPGKMVSSTSHLQYVAVDIIKSLVNQTVVVTMSVKQKSLSSHKTQRILEMLQNPEDVQLGKILIERFDILQANELSGLQSFKLFFTVLSHIILISTIVLVLIGKLHYISNLSILVQILFLHSYIHAQFLPLSYRIPISGLQNMENLNFFTKDTQDSIERMLMGNVIQDSPIRLMEFNIDINFTRAFYPLLIVNAIYLFWFILLLIIHKVIAVNLTPKDTPGGDVISSQIEAIGQSNKQKSILTKILNYLDQIVNRPLNFWHMVFRYQFLTVIWICFLQFYNLKYPAGADRNQIVNAIMCISAFTLTLLIPVGVYVWTRKAYLKLSYDKYINRFNQMFMFQLYSQSLPSHHHHYNLLVESLRWVMCALCCSYLGISPLQSLIILIVVHALSIGYLRWGRPILNITQVKLSYAIYSTLICLQICMLAAFGANNICTKTQYLILGYIMITISIVAICLGFCQLAHRVYEDFRKPISEDADFKQQLATKRIV